MYTDPSCKPWTSRQWAPPGFASRKDLIEQIRASEKGKPLASGAIEEDRIENSKTDEANANANTTGPVGTGVTGDADRRVAGV